MIRPAMSKPNSSEVLPQTPTDIRHDQRRAAALVAFLVVPLVALDLGFSGVSSWCVNHVLASGAVVAAAVGYVAGVVLDLHFRSRRRSRSLFLRERAVRSLCLAAEAAKDLFDRADETRLAAGNSAAPQSDREAETSSSLADRAAETFRRSLAEWRSTLVDGEEWELLRRCERYYENLASAAMYFARYEQGNDVTLGLSLGPDVIGSDAEFFAELDTEMRVAINTREKATIDESLASFWARPPLDRRLELWRAERQIAKTAEYAQRIREQLRDEAERT
jgi:hypothetical protein